MTRRMYDAAYPPASPPTTDAVAFYIGGDTPHVWTAAEIARQRARYRLPIYVRSNPTTALAPSDAAKTIAWLRANKAPHGCAVALDLETAVHATYVKTYDQLVHAAGWVVLAYGSLGTIFQNPRTSGGYWAANPTGIAHMVRGADATQWAFDTQIGRAWDLSDVADTVPLWDTHAPQPSPQPTEDDMYSGSITAGKGAKPPILIDGFKHLYFGFDNTYTNADLGITRQPQAVFRVALHQNGRKGVIEPTVTVGAADNDTKGWADNVGIALPSGCDRIDIVRLDDGTSPVGFWLG